MKWLSVYEGDLLLISSQISWDDRYSLCAVIDSYCAILWYYMVLEIVSLRYMLSLAAKLFLNWYLLDYFYVKWWEGQGRTNHCFTSGLIDGTAAYTYFSVLTLAFVHLLRTCSIPGTSGGWVIIVPDLYTKVQGELLIYSAILNSGFFNFILLSF